MNEERVKRIGINAAAELVGKFFFAKEMLESKGWDIDFIAEVKDRIQEIDAGT